jgi:Protein of unknown function (DUF1292).
MEKDLEKCGCNSEEGSCGCGGHHHDEDHECGCGCNDEENFVIDLEDENGNVVTCPIIDEFECEGKAYYLAQNPEEDSVYLFRLMKMNLLFRMKKNLIEYQLIIKMS